MAFADVAIPCPMNRAFTYSAPDGAGLRPGMRVLVEFRRSRKLGVLLSLSDSPPEGIDPSKIKPILDCPDEEPSLAPEMIELLAWMSRYYCAPIGEAVRAALPSRLLDAVSKRAGKAESPADIAPCHEPPVELTQDQSRALDSMLAAIGGGHKTFLLRGVTGSGKTEVYLRLFEELVARGKSCLLLVPEIGLAPQLAGRAAARFKGRTAVYHSGLTDAQRLAQWRRIRSGEADVVIGTRSALFAPLPSLGAIVVDEEHDSSYKQDEGFTYHGRDSAIMRAHIQGALCVLGSATPSLESAANAGSGKYSLHELRSRIGASRMPSIETVDMRSRGRAGRDERGLACLSPELYEALAETLDRGEQALLYLGRRGFASALHCESCGEAARCPNCDISLTAHAGNTKGFLLCHYCGYRLACPDTCPSCGSTELTPVGHGTQRLEAEITDFFPQARLARLDSDAAQSSRVRNSVFRGMRDGTIDILIGTQMVTKGHDFPGITLVGVVCADQALAIPDFRASERAFQLITQVAGRAGRGAKPGRVIVQTFQPDHPGLAAAALSDIAGFVEQELEFRQRAGYPPFARLAVLRLSSLKEGAVKEAAGEAGAILKGMACEGIEILGPAPACMERLRNRHRWQILIKARSTGILGAFAARLMPQIESKIPRSTRISLDIDPVNLL